MGEGTPGEEFDFQITQEHEGDGPTVVAVSGEIDIFTAPELKAALSAAIESGATEVVVDLSETRFLDSSALGVLIGVVKKLRHVDGHLTVVNTEPSTARTFEITGLDKIFAIVETRDEALAAASG